MKSNKLLATVLCGTVTAALLAGCGSGGSTSTGSAGTASSAETSSETASTTKTAASDGDLPTITLELICGSIPSETESVEQAVSEITKDYGFKVSFIPIEIANTSTQLNLLLSGGDSTLDVYMAGSGITYGTVVNNGQALDLTDLLADYSDEMKKALGEDVYNAGLIGGKLYGVAHLLDQASTPVYNLRGDIASKYGYKNGDKIDLAELNELFAKIHADYPDTPLIGPMNGVPNIGDSRVDKLGDNLGVLGNYGQDTKVIDYYSSDYFKELVGYFKTWSENGYYIPDILNVTDAPSDYIPNGKCFGCFAGHFSAEMNGIWASQNYGCDMASLQIYPDATAVTPWAYECVNPACAHPKEAATLIYLLATNSDIENLIINGIEGQDYQVLDDGSAAYVDGKDVASTGWCMGYSWTAVNSTISIPFNYPADYYDQLLAANANAKKSKAFGCQFDETSVSDQITACTNVVNQYYNALEGGAVTDFDATLEEFTSALKSSGIDDIIACKQQQLDAYLAK